MFYHKECKSPVLITNLAEAVFRFGLSDRGIKITVGNLIETKEHASFYCTQCKKDINKEDLLGLCNHTRQLVEIEELYKIYGVGGIYTKESLIALGLEDKKRLLVKNLIEKVDI